MKWEYLIFNAAVVTGPLIASFERNLRFVRYWRHAFAAIGITAIPFIAWDIAVTGSHWHFNDAYTLPYRLMGLPPGEWLFFLTVPFAGLFVWQVLQHYRPDTGAVQVSPLARMSVPFITAGALLTLYGLEYTGLAIIALAAAVGLDTVLRTGVFAHRNTLLYAGFIIAATAVFNGYLTARPVVLYNESTMTGIRLGTIPLEDFVYGAALLLINTVLFERFKRGGRRG